MICAKFGWNLPSGSGEEDFKFVNVFSQFRNYLILGMGGALYLNKHESGQRTNFDQKSSFEPSAQVS